MGNKQQALRSGRPRRPLGPRERILAFQFPLTLLVAGTGAGAAWLLPAMLESSMVRAGLGLHAALALASLLLPWQRLTPLALLALPVLDLMAIGLLLDGGVPETAALSVLFVFPALWIAASPLPRTGALLLCFVGPFAAGLAGLGTVGPEGIPGRLAWLVVVAGAILALGAAVRMVQAGARSDPFGPGGSPAGTADGELQALQADVSGLAAALAAKDDVVSTVSHELRTPLTSIIGNLDLVLADSGELPGPAVRRLEIAQRNAERLLALISDLLMAGSSALTVSARRTDLSAIVEATLSSAQAHARSMQVSLSADVSAPLWAHADPLRISQALDNLVSNAIKYSPDGGDVRVYASTGEGWVRLHVEDNGMGMTAADAAQIFTRFFRSPAVRDHAIPGAGLGLAITKAIVEGHGGTISCHSRPGHGSTFTVALPLTAARVGASTD